MLPLIHMQSHKPARAEFVSVRAHAHAHMNNLYLLEGTFAKFPIPEILRPYSPKVRNLSDFYCNIKLPTIHTGKNAYA